MLRVKVVFYADEKGCQIVEWLDDLPKKIRAKARFRIDRLAELGHELRRPEADFLRDEIYELRWRYQSMNYRILYFFHGREAVVLSHGLVKEEIVPPREIDLAKYRKKLFESDPFGHTYKEDDYA